MRSSGRGKKGTEEEKLPASRSGRDVHPYAPATLSPRSVPGSTIPDPTPPTTKLPPVLLFSPDVILYAYPVLRNVFLFVIR